MSTKLRAGVVGVGSMGWNHARIYGELDNAELAATHQGVILTDTLHARLCAWVEAHYPRSTRARGSD